MATLAEQHRTAQARLAARLAQVVARSWARTMTGVPTPGMSEAWIASMLDILRVYHERSEGSAALYYDRQRFAMVPDASPFAGADADELPDEQIFTSLDVTGRVAVLEALQGGKNDVAGALELAQTSVQGAAARLALSGGRSYTLNAFAADSLSVAYYRNARQGCCAFCAMLASRGAVYREDSFAESDPRFFGPGNAKVHDHCYCTIECTWRRDVTLPSFNEQMTSLWKAEVKDKGLSGSEAQNAFRNAYEATYGRRD